MAKTKAAQRKDAAEEVCWTLITLMHLGLLDVPKEERTLIAEPMQKWADLATETGILPKDDPLEIK